MKKLLVFLLPVVLFAGLYGCAGPMPTAELPDQQVTANQQERNAGL